MITAEDRSARARKAAAVRWAWGADGRALRAEMYYRRIMRAIRSGNPRSLSGPHRAAIRRVLLGTPFPEDL